MANQIVVSAGAKVRNLNGVLTGTSGVVSSVPLGAANGVATLDSGGKVPVSQLPSSVVTYLGTWNAATNTPTLVNGTGDNGDLYICNVSGTVNFGAGPISFVVGDWVLYGSGTWQKSSGQNGTVTSVGLSTNGGAITIGNSPITTSGVISANFNGTNLQYVNGAGNLTTFPTLITSIGLSMPSAFSVANSPLTANGTIAVTGAGVASQYIRGDGTLADFPSSGGGGSSVSYYLNGGTSQGTIGGTTYYEMSKTADTGTMADFTKTGDGFIVAFLTDANDPAQLNIPAGNWNYEIYASMSSNGGTPAMYAELYVYDGTTFTLISTSANEIIYDGTALNLYTFAMAVPATSLTLTDRLAIKLYATNSGGKTTTIYTQDSHLCQIITTFSTGITALNGLTAQVQYFQTGTSGTDFNISSTTATHTFNLPTASAANRGALSSADWTIFNGKQPQLNGTGFVKASGTTITYDNSTYYLASNPSAFIALTALSAGTGISYNNTTGVITNSAPDQTVALTASTGISVTGTYPNFTITNTSPSSGGTVTSVAALTIGTTGTDLSSTVANSTTTPVITLNVPTASATNRGALSSADWTTFNSKQGTITLTTTGTSGAATFSANTLNIPNYGSALSGYLPLSGGTLTGALNGTSASFSSSVAATQLNAVNSTTTGSSTLLSISKASGYGTINFNLSYDSTYFSNGKNLTLLNEAGYAAAIFAWNNAGTQSNFLVPNGNVGIGTTSPTARLDLGNNVGSANTANQIALFSSSGIALYGFGISGGQLNYISGGAHSFYNTATAATQMLITSGGNVLIGTTTDAGYKLQTSTNNFTIAKFVTSASQAQILLQSTDAGGYALYQSKGGGANTWQSGAWPDNSYRIGISGVADYMTMTSGGNTTFYGSVTATSFFESSDSRLKTLIQDNYQTKGIASITPKLYTKNGKVELGYYAQDFVGILDSAVSKGSDDMLSLSYREVLVAKVYALEQEIKDLKAKMN